MSFNQTGRAPSKAEQEAEAAARRGDAPLGEDGNLEVAPEGVEDQSAEIEDRPAAAEGGEGAKTPPAEPRTTPGNEARERIAKAAQERRQKAGDYDHDALSLRNVFGTLLDPPKPAPTAEDYDPTRPDPGVPAHTIEPVTQPRKIKLADGIELSEEQVLELARKGLKGDQYVAEAQDLLERTRAAVRPATPSEDGDQPAHPAEPDTEGEDSIDYQAAVEKIQLGDPQEAAEALKQLVERGRPDPEKAVAEHLMRERFRADGARAQKDFDAFKTNPANQDLLADPDAVAAIERRTYEGYRKDLKAIGLTDDQIPSDPNQLALQHRYFRVNGHDIRPNIDVLKEAVQGYRAKVGPQRSTNPTQVREGAPRVEVNRTTRRENLPTQPSRSAAPQLAPASQPDGMTRQQRLVMEARKARGFPVG